MGSTWLLSLLDSHKSISQLGFEICYEDLISEQIRSEFIQTFLKDLGLEATQLTSHYQKVTSNSLLAAVNNVEEFTKKLSGTVFAPSLHNDDFDIVNASA